jgi:hypothetical protein
MIIMSYRFSPVIAAAHMLGRLLAPHRRPATGCGPTRCRASPDELSRREQRTLLLRFGDNPSQEEVAARLGISQVHVFRLRSRALAGLRGLLLGAADS